MCYSVCDGQDPWVSGRACMRLGIQKYPYGIPNEKAGCPCKRNLIIQKIACGMIAFRDCLTDGCSPIKLRELSFTLSLGDNGLYSPVKLSPYPFNLHIHLIFGHLIDITIGKLCRFAKFRFEIKDWTLIFKRMK